jgi:hypothetical protein
VALLRDPAGPCTKILPYRHRVPPDELGRVICRGGTERDPVLAYVQVFPDEILAERAFRESCAERRTSILRWTLVWEPGQDWLVEVDDDGRGPLAEAVAQRLGSTAWPNCADALPS